MVRSAIGLLVAAVAVGSPQTTPALLSVCDLSKDFGVYRNKMVAVRGVYYYGLRQACSQKCANGPWPSFLDLIGTDAATWKDLAQVLQTVEVEAKKGKRLEIWVTAVGQLRTRMRLWPLGPCRLMGRHDGYGHLGVFPAQVVVKVFTDIEVKVNPESPYDYSHMYHGAL
jgi:hypothetical protein